MTSEEFELAAALVQKVGLLGEAVLVLCDLAIFASDNDGSVRINKNLEVALVRVQDIRADLQGGVEP
jgi:hypothetical protein